MIASGLSCAGLLGSAANVAIAKQVITVASQSATDAPPPALSLDAAPLETAVVLPPEYFPLEIPTAEETASKSNAPSSATAGAVAEDWVASAAEAPADATIDIDVSAADAPSVAAPAAELITPAPAAQPVLDPVEVLPTESTSAPTDSGAEVDFGAQYIDPTDYSVGATEPTAAPDVVLSERSTGCKTVLRQGEAIPSSVCGDAAPAAPGSAGSAGSVARRASPRPAVNAVRVGAVSIDGNGIHLRRSVRDYYSRTARPRALQSNGNRALMFPLAIPARISSPFGWRVHPIFGNHRLHTGTDLSAAQGTPIVAAYSGRVALSDILGGYGVTVVLQHDERSAQTLYGHMSEVFVKSGEWVEQGTVIGRVGSTGNSTGPHLHFEYRQRTADGWVAVNAGELLNQSLAYLQDGFQLAAVQINAGTSLEIPQLSIPKLLRAGKDATKEASPDGAIAANIAAPEMIAVPGIVAKFESRTPAAPQLVTELESIAR